MTSAGFGSFIGQTKAISAENEMGVEAIVARGHPSEVVTRIEHLLYMAEAPPQTLGAVSTRGRPLRNGCSDKNPH